VVCTFEFFCISLLYPAKASEFAIIIIIIIIIVSMRISLSGISRYVQGDVFGFAAAANEMIRPRHP
jgi:hypothetical protein